MDRYTEDLALMRLARIRHLRNIIGGHVELDTFDKLLLDIDRKYGNSESIGFVARKVMLPESMVKMLLNKVSAKLEYMELTC